MLDFRHGNFCNHLGKCPIVSHLYHSVYVILIKRSIANRQNLYFNSFPDIYYSTTSIICDLSFRNQYVKWYSLLRQIFLGIEFRNSSICSWNYLHVLSSIHVQRIPLLALDFSIIRRFKLFDSFITNPRY